MKKGFHLLSLATALLLSIFFAGCNNSEAKDSDIKAEAEKALKDDPAGTNVKVEVKDCVVTLSGTWPNNNTRDQLTMKMETVPHVKSVVNNCIVPEREMTDEELNKHLYDLTKDLSTLNSIKFGAMNGIVAIAGPVTRKEWETLKINIDKLKPKGYDTAMLNVQ